MNKKQTSLNQDELKKLFVQENTRSINFIGESISFNQDFLLTEKKNNLISIINNIENEEKTENNKINTKNDKKLLIKNYN